jgi:hypothetical protein
VKISPTHIVYSEQVHPSLLHYYVPLAPLSFRLLHIDFGGFHQIR